MNKKRLPPLCLFLAFLFSISAASAANLPADRYTLQLAHSSKCVNVASGSTSNNALLQQLTCDDSSLVQAFDISPTDSGYYRLINANSGKAMRVAGGSASAGASIVQYTWYDWDSQHFKPQANGDGYILRNRYSNQCVELQNDSQNDGAQLVQQPCDGSVNQTFNILPTEEGERNVADGRYTVKAVHSGKCLDVPNSSTSNGTQLQQWSCNGSAAQQFDFLYVGDGQYEIINANSGKCLDLYYGYTYNGTNIEQYTCNQGNNQRWLVNGLGNGQFHIQTILGSNKHLDIENISVADGAKTHLWEYNGKDNQKWTLEPVVYNNTVQDAVYNIVAKHSGKCLDVPGSSTSPGTKLQQHSCNGTSAQSFQVVHQSDGYYRISNTNSELSLSVRDFSNNTNAAIEQDENLGGDNQLFRFVPNGSGYVIRPKSSYQCMDVNANGYSSNYGELEQFTCNYNDNQTFELQMISADPSYSPGAAVNNDTVVLLHGFAGWGRGELFGLKYWGGGWKGDKDLQEYLKSQGHDTVTLAVGPLSSNWDRAVEAYYQLKGGCVDYGAAHAATHNHDRYGRCYDPLLSDWDASNQIHIVAHSQGGQTARVLLKLLRDGAAAENFAAGTPFEGGKDWVKSITTLATPHDGTTLTEFVNPLDITENIVTEVYRIAGLASGENVVYDLKLDQWGIDRGANESWSDYFQRVKDDNLWANSQDTSLYDLSPEGAPYIYGGNVTYPDVYYFSFPTQSSYEGLLSGNHYPIISNFLLFMPQSIFMGQYTNSGLGVDSTWFPNDSVVNTVSMDGPAGAPIQMYNGTPVTGVWQNMGLQNGWDHLDITGLFTLKNINPLYLEHVQRLKSLN